jgi:hypothetical protein
MSVITQTNSTLTLQALLCDGTVNNTGHSNGIIRKLEESVGRPLQWLVCLLHLNELPLRHFLSSIEGGVTTGPKSATGKITSALDFDPKDLPIKSFTVVPGKVIDVGEDIRTDLSADQQYLLRASLSIQEGYSQCENITFLQTAAPGNLNNARWLTKANRILRLHMSTDSPSKMLLKVVSFITNVYAPAWFHIKLHCSCLDGAKNFFYIMQLTNQLDHSDRQVIQSVLQNNCYFAHPENILLAAVFDDDQSIRQAACDKIIQARQNTMHNSIRVFSKSDIKLDFSAVSYLEMIEWSSINISPPPLLANISDEELRHCQRSIFEKIPCHSQAVERTVKDISQSSSKVLGHLSRHGMILQTKKSRRELPRFDSKSDFLQH